MLLSFIFLPDKVKDRVTNRYARTSSILRKHYRHYAITSCCLYVRILYTGKKSL